MGISKAMMEKVAIAQGRALGEGASTTICCTRYGNVMASRGSVIPLWVEQMMERKPITITDPNMTRFMMTLDDAVDLVVYAFTHGHNGDLFVQKAPAATLSTLAQALIEKLCTQLVDKYRVRDFIKERIGEEYLIPLLGVWEHFDEIDFDVLPEEFVLKTNHGSGGVLTCQDKSRLDLDDARHQLSLRMMFGSVRIPSFWMVLRLGEGVLLVLDLL